MSTSTALDDRPVSEYVRTVTGEAVLGQTYFVTCSAGLRDIVGSRFAGYESSLKQARELVAEATAWTLGGSGRGC